MRRIQLFTEDYASTAGLDTGVSHAVLEQVGVGALPETVRLHHTSAIVAFGKHDTISSGYRRAVAASVREGFTPIERLAGGRAAVFHPGTLAFAWAIPSDDPRAGVTERFQAITAVITEALRSFGVDVRVGEIPGEYCPGAHSIHSGGRIKLVGVGQRLIRGAAHVGGVVSVTDGERIRHVLEPVYRELGLDWIPSTAGALDDLVPGVTVDDVRDAIVTRFSDRFEIRAATIPEPVLELGRRLAPHHVATV